MMLLLLAALTQSACAAAEPQAQAAFKFLEARDWAAAEQVLLPFASSDTACPGILVALGRLQLGRRNYPQADRYSELALSNGPEDAEALLFRGEMLSLRGKVTEAQELLQKAVSLAPDNAEAHFQLGTLFDRLRKNPEAVKEFRSVTQLRPSDPRAFDYLALNLEPLGEVAPAETAYQQGLNVNQGPRFDAFLDYNYGRLLAKLNRLEQANRHLDRAVELAPKVRAVHYDRAKLLMRLGKLQQARTDAEAALTLPDPGGFILDLQVYNLLVSVYSRLGEGELARRYTRLAEQATVPLRSRDRK
jgi:tetratricopeptide (TPR) repeat protein